MEILTFAMLVTQFSKHQQELKNAGFEFSYEAHDNLFRDVMHITYQDSFKHYYFSIEHHNWNVMKEFVLNTNLSRRYCFRLNPVDGSPLRVNHKNEFCHLWTAHQETPADLESFAERILGMITEIYNKIMKDKLDLISTL